MSKEDGRGIKRDSTAEIPEAKRRLTGLEKFFFDKPTSRKELSDTADRYLKFKHFKAGMKEGVFVEACHAMVLHRYDFFRALFSTNFAEGKRGLSPKDAVHVIIPDGIHIDTVKMALDLMYGIQPEGFSTTTRNEDGCIDIFVDLLRLFDAWSMEKQVQGLCEYLSDSIRDCPSRRQLVRCLETIPKHHLSDINLGDLGTVWQHLGRKDSEKLLTPDVVSSIVRRMSPKDSEANPETCLLAARLLVDACCLEWSERKPKDAEVLDALATFNMATSEYADHPLYDLVLEGSLSRLGEYVDACQTRPKLHEVLANSHRNTRSLHYWFTGEIPGLFVRYPKFPEFPSAVHAHLFHAPWSSGPQHLASLYFDVPIEFVLPSEDRDFPRTFRFLAGGMIHKLVVRNSSNGDKDQFCFEMQLDDPLFAEWTLVGVAHTMSRIRFLLEDWKVGLHRDKGEPLREDLINSISQSDQNCDTNTSCMPACSGWFRLRDVGKHRRVGACFAVAYLRPGEYGAEKTETDNESKKYFGKRVYDVAHTRRWSVSLLRAAQSTFEKDATTGCVSYVYLV